MLVQTLVVSHLSIGMPETPWAQGDPGVTLEICDADGEKALMILVWMRVPVIGNASHPRALRIMKVRPLAMRSSWRENFRMLKNNSIGGMS